MIVDPTNVLTINSANALLKALEEPPPRTVFFLISHGAAAVLPTIRSRCTKLAFRSLSAPDFQSTILRACVRGGFPEPGEKDLARLYSSSRGSPGRALPLIVGGLLPLSAKLERIMGSLPRLDYALVHELVQSLGGARNAENFGKICDLIEEQIEEKGRQMALADPAHPLSAAAWAELWKTIRERRIELEALNLDKGAFLMTAFSDIEQVARKTMVASSA
jgi:DNA polymerase-3 subunit delta'